MPADLQPFFSACLSAGAILTGFCGTFLSFRIQREANYYRQPVLDFKTGTAKDVPLGLSHFSSAFLLLLIATLLAASCGFVLPLLGLAGAAVPPRSVVAGMTAALIFVIEYFACELVHYGVLNRRLLHDRDEWGRSTGVVVVATVSSVVSSYLVVVYLQP